MVDKIAITGLEDTDDVELLDKIQSGDRQAFALLVRRHTGRFYAVAYRFLSNSQEAEDVVQEAFLKLWEYPGLWNKGKNTRFTTWFYRIIVNRCLDIKKRKTVHSLPEEDEITDSYPLQDEMLVTEQTRNSLEIAIASLPERQRTALNLCFYEGLSNQEAAVVMELSLKALQSLLIRAKTTLKGKFKTYA